jgi:UDPglucose 6-dehydrogenase
MNDYQKKRFSMKMVKSMLNTVTGKKIAILGYAFKKDTGDVRETPSQFIVRDLLLENALIHIYDPQVCREDMWIEMDYTCGINKGNTPRLEESITTSDDPYKACEGAHAFATLTEWDEFKDLDYQRIFDSMAKPAFAFDGRNILDHDKLRQIGFEVYAIGKPSKEEFL